MLKLRNPRKAGRRGGRAAPPEVRAGAAPATPPAPPAKKPKLLRAAAPKPVVELDPARPALEVPPLPNDCTLLEERTVRPGLCAARLLFQEAEGTFLYEVHEPRLEDFEAEAMEFLRQGLRRCLGHRDEDASEAQLERIVEAQVDELAREHLIRIDAVSRGKVLYYLLRDFVGYGRIDALMRDPAIEDISCDGPALPVFLFHRKHEAVRTTVVFPAARELDAFVLLLAQRSGKHLSIATPLLDATLPDKSRLQSTFGAEVTPRGSSFTIRRFRADPITPPLLLDYGTLSPEMAAWCWLAIEHGQSGLVVGGTASGKTTTLNACSLFIPGEKKIVSIEDTHELNLPHQNWVAGVTRGGGELLGSKAAGEVGMYDLLAAALRQRPEYLLVGEVRGAEANTLFQAMATGHATYSTMHADSVHGAIHRLEHEPISVPRIMLENLRFVAVQAQVTVGDRLVRRVREVVELKGIDPESGHILTNTVFQWDAARDAFERSPRSYVVDRAAERLQRRPEDVWQEVENRAAVLRWLQGAGITNYVEVARFVQRYRRNPAEVLAMTQRPAIAPAQGKNGSKGGAA